MEVKEVVKKLEGYRNLENDWDGYGALRPFEEVVNNAIDVVRKVPCEHIDDTYPNPNGTVSIDWELGKHRISAEFGIEDFAFYSILNGKVSYHNNVSYGSNGISHLVLDVECLGNETE